MSSAKMAAILSRGDELINKIDHIVPALIDFIGNHLI